jgi:hypothetical protein
MSAYRDRDAGGDVREAPECGWVRASSEERLSRGRARTGGRKAEDGSVKRPATEEVKAGGADLSWRFRKGYIDRGTPDRVPTEGRSQSSLSRESRERIPAGKSELLFGLFPLESAGFVVGKRRVA